MNRIIMLFILSLSLNSIDIHNSIYSFVGFDNHTPLFFDEVNHVLVKKSSSNIQILKSFEANQRVILVKNDFFVIEHENDDGQIYALLINSEQKKRILLKSEMTYLHGNQNNLFYTNLKTKEIIMLSMEGEKATNIKGFVVGYEQGFLYFALENNLKTIRANVDIYRVDLNRKGNCIEKIVTDVAGVRTRIICDGKYIFDDSLISGQFKPCIISTQTGQITLLDIPKDYNGFDVYFSSESNSLHFYNDRNLDTFAIDLNLED